MDIVLALAFSVGLAYAMIRGARWAFKIDDDEARRQERIRQSRRESDKLRRSFESIVESLRKESK